MRLYRLPLAAPILLLSIVFCGCSNRAATITGNERLARGPGGLGTTTIQAPSVDRDTYVTPGTADYVGTLLAGRGGGFEARAFFKFLSFSLPDTNLPGFTPGDVLFELPHVELHEEPIAVRLDLGITDAALADSGLIGWPGPGVGSPLGTIDYDFTGPLLLSLGSGSFSFYKSWAITPSTVPGFILSAPLSQGFAAFRGRAARFRVPYTWNRAGTIVSDTTSTTVPFDLFLHPPMTPTATGTDTSLVLGGPYEAGVVVRAPVPVIPPGASVNELRLVLAVTDSVPDVNGAILKNTTDTTRVSVTVTVQQITAAWPEGVTDRSALAFVLSPIRTILQVAVEPGDSLSIALPPSLARGWSENPVTNQGVLVSIINAGTNPGLLIGSRESSRPPVLRVSTTSPPPGRF
ncbi:MAG: hypothetical protein ACRENN_01710 [Candidatus Eiseniibacteriota bacterium]